MIRLLQKHAASIAFMFLCLLALSPEPAFAQIAGLGGGGAGLLDVLIQWFVQNFVQGFIYIGILGIGVTLVFSHHSIAGAALIIVGCLITANYQAIGGLLHVGG